MPHDVFISYSTDDKTIANAVVEKLEKTGIPCWIAPRDVIPGVEYAEAIIEAINNCKVFLLILSSASNSSSMVTREVDRAVSKGVKILPFRIDNAVLTKAMEFYLSNRHWMDASTSPFEKHLNTLVESVTKLLDHEYSDQISIQKPEHAPIASDETASHCVLRSSLVEHHVRSVASCPSALA